MRPWTTRWFQVYSVREFRSSRKLPGLNNYLEGQTCAVDTGPAGRDVGGLGKRGVKVDKEKGGGGEEEGEVGDICRQREIFCGGQ